MPAPMIGHHADEATREEIAAAIADWRAQANRYSFEDRRRRTIEGWISKLTDDWLAARG